jgi:hypothetical protein
MTKGEYNLKKLMANVEAMKKGFTQQFGFAIQSKGVDDLFTEKRLDDSTIQVNLRLEL